jgi:type III restriction enzyme
MAAARGLVQCYVRNDRLELTVPYEFYGQHRVYEPDFVVRLADGSHVMLEVKGPEPAQVSAKHEAAQRWVTAVNRWGQLGRWTFLPCHEPQRLLDAIATGSA